MRRYALLLISILILLAIFGLPPRPYDRWWFRTPHRTAERQALMDLQEELILESWLYQRIQWRDSIVSALEGVDPSVQPYVMTLPEWARDTARVVLEEGITQHLAYLDVPQPKVPIGVFIFPRDLDAHPRSLRDRYGYRWTQREIYVAREGEDAFCGLLEPVAVEGGYNGLNNTINRLAFLPKSSVAKPNTLRICGYYARYGVPGAEIESWLHRGGASFGSGSNLSRRLGILRNQVNLRAPFGRLGYIYSLTEVGMGCLAGIAPACLRAFDGDPELPPIPYWRPEESLGGKADVSPVDYISSRWSSRGHFGGYDEFLFESMEEQFGRERFEAFWTSELPVLEAFQSAFGLPVEEWVMSWAQGLYGPLDRGPAVPVKASVLTFLTIGLFAAFAAALAGRRG